VFIGALIALVFKGTLIEYLLKYKKYAHELGNIISIKCKFPLMAIIRKMSEIAFLSM